MKYAQNNTGLMDISTPKTRLVSLHFPNDLPIRGHFPKAKITFTNEHITIGKFDSSRDNAVVEFGVSKSPDLSGEIFVIWIENQLVGELQLKYSGLLLLGATIAKKEHLGMGFIGKIGVMHTVKNGRRFTSIGCRVAKAINQVTPQPHSFHQVKYWLGQ